MKTPKLIFLRSTLTPDYGQGGEKIYPLPLGTVLQVREERKVDGEFYYVTIGGIVKASDVLLLNEAAEILTKEIRELEKSEKPTHTLLHLYGLFSHKAGRFDRGDFHVLARSQCSWQRTDGQGSRNVFTCSCGIANRNESNRCCDK